MKVVLYTPLDIEQVTEKLQQSVDSRLLATVGDSHPFRGSVKGNDLRLRRSPYFGDGSWANSFAPTFYGELSSDLESGGTEIEGEFRENPMVRTFTATWFFFAGLGAMISTACGISDQCFDYAAIPLLMILLGWALTYACRRLAKADEPFIMEQLGDLLGATTEVPGISDR